MKLIVGLGNPGEKYLMTRHNIGFMVIDALAETDSFQNKFKTLIQKISIDKKTCLIAKPQTYMNLSGEAVRKIVDFYKIKQEDLLVIQDDVDQKFLSLKFQKNRSHGGHNGIENIHNQLNTADYARLKLGVGRSLNSQKSTADHVLSSFEKEEIPDLKSFIEKSVKSVLHFVNYGFDSSATQFNKKETQ